MSIKEKPRKAQYDDHIDTPDLSLASQRSSIRSRDVNVAVGQHLQVEEQASNNHASIPSPGL